MKLFKPTTINNLKLKNRLVMPPMCTYQVYKQDGIANAFHHAHYLSRAIGQIGLIIVESTGVSENGRISNYDLGLYDDSQIDSLKQMVNAIHEQGSQVAIQLNHAGRKSRTTKTKIVGPSALSYNNKEVDYHELTQDEILDIITAFKEAASRADEAGFDAIEIHGAHGYLIHQFVSPLSNVREDKYGTDRFLFLKEIIHEIKKVWPQEKAILLRISASDYASDGINHLDWIQFLNENSDLVDLIHVSSGGLINTKIETYPGYQLKFARAIKEQTSYPVIGVGLINEPDLVISALELGACDLVACGRKLLSHPNFFLEIAQKYERTDLIPDAYKRAY